jgi:hypothetical protein
MVELEVGGADAEESNLLVLENIDAGFALN